MSQLYFALLFESTDCHRQSTEYEMHFRIWNIFTTQVNSLCFCSFFLPVSLTQWSWTQCNTVIHILYVYADEHTQYTHAGTLHTQLHTGIKYHSLLSCSCIHTLTCIHTHTYSTMFTEKVWLPWAHEHSTVQATKPTSYSTVIFIWGHHLGGV